MRSNVRMILDEVNARIKLAEAKTAEDPSNFDAFPGAENDKKVPASLKDPDPEVKDEGPASRTEVTGAEPGSDAPVQQDNKYEADEPVLTPEKKPADSSDAEAKTASANPEVAKVASDILGIIKGSLNKQAGCCQKSTSAGSCGSDNKNKKEKKASEDMINLGTNILDKIASIRMAKQAGANDAISLIKAAEEYNRGANDARALIEKLAQAMEESAASADAGAADEAAGAADAEAAMADAAAADAAAGTDMGSEAGDDQVTPEEVAQAVSELVDEGQISQEDAATIIEQISGDAGAEGGEGDVTEDQIAEGIAQAIESGEITEDEAQQLVQELVDAGADESVQQQVADDASADAGAADEAAGAADAEAAMADASKCAEALQKQAEDEQVARYQRGFIQKCAEYGTDPQRVAQYLQARLSGQI